jgi:Ca2+-transporting ATPase
VRVTCTGAPEAIIGAPVVTEDGTAHAAMARAEEFAREGLRVLAVAVADRPDAPAGDGGVERGLRLLGLVAIADPPRPSAQATIASCQSAGITPMLITGDHPATARVIATELGIIGRAEQVADCRQMTVGARAGLLARARVFARATPEQKLETRAGRVGPGDPDRRGVRRCYRPGAMRAHGTARVIWLAAGPGTSRVRECMISAREGRPASWRRSMIRTSAP